MTAAVWVSRGSARAELLRTVAAWRDRAPVTPQSARNKAAGWLRWATGDPHARAAVEHVTAIADHERGQWRRAERRARSGSLSTRAELVDDTTQLRLMSARMELDGGEPAASARDVPATQRQLPVADHSRAACLRGLLLFREGRAAPAIAELSHALRGLGGPRDGSWIAAALVGRGSARMCQGELGEAERDFARAERVFADQGRSGLAAGCVHLRACALFRIGDLARALRLFERAVAAGLDIESTPEFLLDRSEALAEAGLHDEAEAGVRRAARRLAENGSGSRLAEALLALSGCRLRAQDSPAARRCAERAGNLFRDQCKPERAALADATWWQARLLDGCSSSRQLAAAQHAGMECASYGWTGTAAQLWLATGRCASRAGMRQRYRRLLRLARSTRDDAAATTQQRCIGWLADALLADEDDDLAAVFAACRAGLREAQDHAAGIAPFELRAQALAPVQELGAVAVGCALRSGSARMVLRWSERCRGSALQRRALPAADPELGAALERLRAVAAGMRGSVNPECSSERVGALEGQVRHRAMLARGGARAAGAEFGVDDVRAELGDAVLLSFFEHRRCLHAVSVISGRVRVHEIGAVGDVEGKVARLVHLLSRQAERDSADPAVAPSSVLRRAAHQVQACLLFPVLDQLREGRPLVVVPAGRLHTVPWSALPVCRALQITTSPSLRCWLQAAQDARGHSGVGQLWVSGPGLEHAEREVRALHDESGGLLLTGSRARCPDVLATLDGVRTAHIAAHGSFRDNLPLLSCVDLADGPLYCYDLERVRTTPATVVLSACEVGRSAAVHGNQISGLAATLLGRGTSTVIASVVPIPDERACAVMLSLHRRLRRSVPPARALAAAQVEHGESGFLCLGYGGRCSG